MKTLILLLSLFAQEAPKDWDPAWFPLAEGDVWLYRTDKGALRLKTAHLQRAGLFRLEDADGDDYLFSSDEKGLLLHGEVKPDGALVSFEPPMGYVTPDLLKTGAAESVHKADDHSVRAKAELVSLRDGALVTKFAYKSGANRWFSIENHLTKGVGPTKRAFRMTKDDGSLVFESKYELVAARVGGKVFPEGADDVLALQMFRHAFEHREVFGPKFPGFAGRVVVTEGGAEKTAELVVSAEGRVTKLEELPRWADQEVRSMIGHRRGSPFEERMGKSVLKAGPATDGRVGVIAEGDQMGSKYEVSDGVMKVVSRLDEGKQRFRIEVREVQWTSRGRYLPTRFDIVTVGVDGAVKEKREVTDEYASLGEDWIPKRRSIKVGEDLKVMEVKDIREK